MKYITFLFLFFISITSLSAQTAPKDTIITDSIPFEDDTIINDTILLQEIVIQKQKLSPEDRKNFLILQNRVYKTYPYAKLASERLVALNKGMAKLSTNKEKKRYFKIVEDYISNEFEGQLKKLSRKQGQILVKLIHRQTGITTYDLIKNLKSGWKAFWSNTTASMFDINLKKEFQPYQDNEDFLIETILMRAFDSGRLQNQKPAHPVDYDNLAEAWQSKKYNSAH